MPHGITQCYLPPGRGDIPAFTQGGGTFVLEHVSVHRLRNPNRVKQFSMNIAIREPDFRNFLRP